ncbi:putative selenium-dependent hydroxylase accessory protein YqeC [Candidatus Aerophobetes bacterium]|nr:putative selenium-dependent hydroxylase accessory protein YqeC [Candidatus Aerophobetes bacterium]
MLISEALDIKGRAFISLVGAGGKSTLFNRLAGELAFRRKRMILTTTTHMFGWQLDPFIKKGKLAESKDENIFRDCIRKYFSSESQGEGLVVIYDREWEGENEKYCGPPSEWLDKWWREGLADFFLVEADGARRRSIKAPAFYEPVIPLSTTDLIGVVGIDAVGLPLQEKNVFRPKIFAQLTGVEFGEKLKIKDIAHLVCHPYGLFKGATKGCNCHLFINKVENKKTRKLAKELASQVFKYCAGRVNDIIIGAACHDKAVELIKGVR